MEGSFLILCVRSSSNTEFSVGVTLNVLNPMVNVTEYDLGDYSIARVCFTAELNESLLRDAVFDIIISSRSTVVNYNISSPQLVIPSHFTGQFNMCVAFTFFGNDRIDGNRTLLYNIRPQSPLDSVYIPSSHNGTYLVVTVIDDEEGGVCIISTCA